MKKIRLFAALLLLGTVLSVGYLPTRAQGENGCGRCNCSSPNSKTFGVKEATETSCPMCDCYIDMID